MLKFIRKYRQILLVVAGILLMIAFLLPQAIQEIATQRQNVPVMKIGTRKVSALQHHEMAMEYEALNRFAGGLLPLMGISEGLEQWILLAELAQRGGYVGAPSGQEMVEEIGRARGMLRMQNQYRDFINNPQLASFFESQIQQDVDAARAAYPRISSELRMTDLQIETALAKFKGVQRLIRGFTQAARVSNPRAVLRAERDLEAAQVEYIFIPADRRLAEIPEPDDAALQAFMEKYKNVKPGEGEYGVGYLLPERVKLEYLVLDAAKIGDKIVPDLRELRRRYSAQVSQPGQPAQTFEEARPGIEQQLKREMVDRVIAAARETIHLKVSQATRKLPDDSQYKILPEDWASKRPTLAGMTPDIVKHVEEKTGLTIDPPEVVVKDSAFLTAQDLGALDLIGKSFIERGQRRMSFPDYVLAVKELQSASPLSLQVGIPSEEPTHDNAGSTFYFTVLDTRPESTPKTIDEIRDRLVTEWKKVEAYKLLAQQDAPGLLQKGIAEGISALDDPKPAPTTPPSPPPASKIKTARVTRGAVSNSDANVNSDIFRVAVIEAADKLDPTASSDSYTPEQRTLSVPLPQHQGVAIVRIRSVAPLTVEEYRGRQAGIVQQFQTDEFRSLKSNPFSLDRLRTRLNVEYLNENGAKRDVEAKVGG